MVQRRFEGGKFTTFELACPVVQTRIFGVGTTGEPTPTAGQVGRESCVPRPPAVPKSLDGPLLAIRLELDRELNVLHGVWIIESAFETGLVTSMHTDGNHQSDVSE